MSVSAKRTALTAMWIAILLSSALLYRTLGCRRGHVGLGVVGTASILFGDQTAFQRRRYGLAVNAARQFLPNASVNAARWS